LCYDDHVESMRALFEALLYGSKKPRPLFTGDTFSPRLLPYGASGRTSCAPTITASVGPDHEICRGSTQHELRFAHDSPHRKPR
jgi:hypothetical protein